MFGYKSIKIAKEFAGTQSRVQFLPVLIGKVKEPCLAPYKRRSGEYGQHKAMLVSNIN